MPLSRLAVDEGAHNSDGLLLRGWDGSSPVMAFVSRRVMDDWVDPRQPYARRKSLYRAEYNTLGNRNLGAIERIVTSKYERGAAFNRQHPFVDVLLADITESGESLDVSGLAG
ncbi:MAG: signal transduction histidine kinase [Xanthobacteraceae bacterium]